MAAANDFQEEAKRILGQLRGSAEHMGYHVSVFDDEKYKTFAIAYLSARLRTTRDDSFTAGEVKGLREAQIVRPE